MYVSYCYVSYKCCTAIQETCIPSEMCVGETCITDGKHTYLVIYVRETRIARDRCAGNILPGETRIPMTPPPQRKAKMWSGHVSDVRLTSGDGII